MVIHQPNLSDGLSLVGWRLKRDAEIRARQDETNFECDVEPSSTSYAAFDRTSVTDDDYNPYAGLQLDLCLEVDAIDLNASSDDVHDDYDPHEVFMRSRTRGTVVGRDRAPLAVLPSPSSASSFAMNDSRHYNFADDDTPVKYPLAIGSVDKHLSHPSNVNRFRHPAHSSLKRAVSPGSDDDIAPTVTEMDALEGDEDDEPIMKSVSSPAKPPYKPSSRSHLLPCADEKQRLQSRHTAMPTQGTKRYYAYDDNDEDTYQQTSRVPARRGRPPSHQHADEPSKKSARLIAQFEEQHGLTLGEMRVYAPKLRLRISRVNVNWIHLPSVPQFPNRVQPF